ncbi:Methyltransferase domain-containing protein [bacterium A37T11]|nr:Methyltransferase domain-containing protein [bacterium A37T11]
MENQNIKRFTARADNYDKYRPGYPQELADYLYGSVNWSPGDVIADIAAGTGIFTETMLSWGHQIYAVEPNPEMRILAQKRLDSFKNLAFIDATAENTTLPNHSVKLITCAQAFHWFDLEKCKIEFMRIAAPEAKAAIIWNRRNAQTPFERAYEKLIISYSANYLQVTQHRISDDDLSCFFNPQKPDYRVFEHTDPLNFTQLRGRTLSYSFLPEEGSEQSLQLLAELQQLFDRHQVGDIVQLTYTTRLFLGCI